MEINNWSMHFVHLCSPFFFHISNSSCGQVPLKRPRVKVKCTDYAFKCRAGSRFGLLKQMLR